MSILVLEKLRQDLQADKISLSDGIVKALSELKESDTIMSWLSSELQGYGNPLSFYYQSNHNLPEYRVVSGCLKLMKKDGSLVNLEHDLANRAKYFLGSPVSWLEESAKFSNDLTITELPEMSHDISSGQGVVIQYSADQLKAILKEVKNRLLLLLK